MTLAIFSIISIGMMGTGAWLLFSGLRTLKRTPKQYERTRAAAHRRILIGIVLIVLCNALVTLIPQEWVIGPVPSAENNYNQPQITIQEGSD